MFFIINPNPNIGTCSNMNYYPRNNSRARNKHKLNPNARIKNLDIVA